MTTIKMEWARAREIKNLMVQDILIFGVVRIMSLTFKIDQLILISQ